MENRRKLIILRGNYFGEPEMRRWWKEKDYLDIIPQTILGQEVNVEEAVELVYGHVTAGEVDSRQTD